MRPRWQEWRKIMPYKNRHEQIHQAGHQHDDGDEKDSDDM